MRATRKFGSREVAWNMSTSINVSCTTCKRKAAQGKILGNFLQDTFKTAF